MRSAASLLHRLTWADLDPAYLRRLVCMARDEDLAGFGLRVKPRRTGDWSTAALPATRLRARADLIARAPSIACGLPLLPLILTAYGGRATARLRTRDGRKVRAGGRLATLTGDPHTLLAAERVILNFIQHLSGVATHTRQLVDALGRGPTRLLDTRKTTPGYRMLEKYAVACGGGWNHRLGLFDRVMLKDNHLAGLGFAPPENSKLKTQNSNSIPAHRHPHSALAAAVAAARRAAPDLAVEVEVDALAQIPPVLAAGADVILLDNFTPAQIGRAVALIAGRARTEASGGISGRNLVRYRGLGLDFISTGAPVHHSPWADIGLDWRP
jgi:nicotinate-nucleotide pyrophosphorylase (carboxylating)